MTATETQRAGQWQRSQVAGWRTWTAGSRAARFGQLRTFTTAVNVVSCGWMDTRERAQAVVDQLVPTLDRCDSLAFDDYEQVVAYAMWHLSDRYARVIQALDGLFFAGHLPIRKTRMAVLEVGAGPAPAIYAVQDYYTDLARWCRSSGQPLQPFSPTHLHTLDHGSAWGTFVHALSEELLSQDPTRHPLPFGTTYKTLAGFSVHELHIEGIERASRQLQAEYEVGDEYLNAQAAQQIALQQRRYAPGAYDLIVMCNFLTTSELTEDFKVEIGELSRSLTPGGVLLVLGSSVPSYQELYARLNVIVADAAWLRSVAVFDGPVQAHSNDAVRGLIAAQVITGLDHARSLAPDAFATVQESLPRDVRQLDRAMVQFPKFVALAFKNEGRRPRGRWGSDRRRAKSA